MAMLKFKRRASFKALHFCLVRDEFPRNVKIEIRSIDDTIDGKYTLFFRIFWLIILCRCISCGCKYFDDISEMISDDLIFQELECQRCEEKLGVFNTKTS